MTDMLKRKGTPGLAVRIFRLGLFSHINNSIMSGSLHVRKPLKELMAEADDSEKGLKRTLSAGSLVALGIGAIIGAGLFVRTAAAAAQNAGPAVTLGFIVAALGSAFAGLCYAEFAAM